MYIICSNYGIIQDIHDDLVTILECDNNMIIMQPISDIILYTSVQLHKNFLYPTLEQYLQIKATNIQLIVYKKNNNIYKYLKLDTRITYYKNIYCITILKIENLNNNILYTSQLSELKQTQNMIIISLNIKDSVKLMNNDILSFINIYKIFYNHVIELIGAKYYNYIYIHNTTENNIILFANITATIVYSFMSDLYELINDNIIFNASVTYGMMYTSIIDKLHFFGLSMNRINLYKNEYKPLYFCSDIYYYNKLVEETNEKIDVINEINNEDIVFIPYL